MSVAGRTISGRQRVHRRGDTHADVLLGLLNGTVDRGNTVVVIEHNLAVIEQAYWIVDLGPEGGKNGGEIVFTGTPEKLVAAEGSLTGEYLRRYQSAIFPCSDQRRLP